MYVLVREYGVEFSMSLSIHQTGIEGCSVELQPMFGKPDSAVLHMLSGGAQNPEGFGPILDVYACTAKGKGVMRGGHYHKVLEEFFFPATGSSLWVMCDFRPESPTYQKTTAVVLSIEPVESPNGLPVFTAVEGSFPRLRVPHGVYHAFMPITEERVLVTALASTPHDATDYVYPTLDEIIRLEDVLGEELYQQMKKNIAS